MLMPIKPFQLAEDSMVKLDRIRREANVMLVFAHSYGLTGFVRISVKEHTVIESKPDHFLDDLRLNCPWPELRRDGYENKWRWTGLHLDQHLKYVW
ncbi:hypothetical protein ACSBR1_039161 [Camellia fascicularis]